MDKSPSAHYGTMITGQPNIPKLLGSKRDKLRGVKTNVLLVEDSKFLKIALERSLIKAGFAVVIAQDGEEGLRIARQTLPDLILLDMLLPKLGGQEVLQALKGDQLTADIPVIILSSLSQQNEEKLKKAGAAAYFEKAKLIEDANSGKLPDAISSAVRDSKLLKRKSVVCIE
jgi:CheY-like chemotaxis protein